VHNYHLHYLPFSHIICFNVDLILPLRLLQSYCTVCQSVIIFDYISLNLHLSKYLEISLVNFHEFLAGGGGGG